MTPPYTNIVILTGAGISAESGIQTFRAADGLWENCRVEDVATPEGFAADPDFVQDFYNQRRSKLQEITIQPNAAHLALGELEARFSGCLTIITQNIDDLHERGGNSNVIHMHGELLKARCSASEEVVEHKGDIVTGDLCSCCKTPAQLRPHIVWFGEIPLEMNAIESAIEKADLFVAIGTSGNVYPAAGFVQAAKMHGAHTLEINLEPSATENQFEEKRYGKASVEVPALVAELLVNK
ncbi:Sir2 family NAD+-dependent deacetylase [Psychromonas ossibalaenae]|uniref:Sir2 family NAD+-dependent deacetylase n=1 Tax=Psychromonas ossibalaenae TaxID=444922 RepID=UPI000367A4F0|nr:Sir2 family NAD+-dependent deacetylase [Psychromonas ossibalaenae]